MVISKEIKTCAKAMGYTLAIVAACGLIYINQDRWENIIITCLHGLMALLVIAMIWLLIMGIFSMFDDDAMPY